MINIPIFPSARLSSPKSRLSMSALLCLTLALLAGPVLADGYVDPWGLPSGTATLKLTTIAAIAAGDPVHGFDFATGEIDSLHSYAELVAIGEVDLLLVELELEPGVFAPHLRAPEDEIGYDRELLDSLGIAIPLEEIADMYVNDGQLPEFESIIPAQDDLSCLQLQVDPETGDTAVKYRIVNLDESGVTFDWVWQPNGTMSFIPSAVRRELSFGALKTLYR